MLLNNKNILVGVTGSIAIYKTLELVRLYVKAGANVRVIMTESSKKFISPLAFETISQAEILDDTNENWTKDSILNHIAIGKWADIFVVAPVTANTINKLSNGIADNILLQSLLAYPRIKLLCPAANTNMIENPITKASFKMLTLCNFKVVPSVSKELACRDIGNGAMAEVEDIFDATARELLKNSYWEDRKVVLNGGATIEKIDDVRFISNFSSGKMATALATALYYRGADVCLVGSSDFKVPSDIHIIKTTSTKEMQGYLIDCIRVAKKGKLSSATLMDSSNITLIQKKPYFFGVAAVSDYVPMYPQNGKLKKDDLGDSWSLALKKNIDILESLPKDEIYSIGFKAEMDHSNAKSNGLKMLANKKLDGVCLNILDENNTFGSDLNTIEFLYGENSFIVSGTKLDISFEMLENIQKIFSE
ncbi:MAG: bifunctional phosphopantothenoylcysteine decarboxylase/phosphopantothenate--cysteine ligase CoaBC [Arcobacteraceae bacterium]